MKKLLLTLLTLVSFFSLTLNAIEPPHKVTIYTRDITSGGPKGANMVDETRESATTLGDYTVTTINCSGPGYTPFPTTVPIKNEPYNVDLMNTEVLYAIDQIAKGNLNGSHVNGAIEVDWTGTGDTNNKIIVTWDKNQK